MATTRFDRHVSIEQEYVSRRCPLKKINQLLLNTGIAVSGITTTEFDNHVNLSKIVSPVSKTFADMAP